jgi:hypothetical protein
VEGDCNAQVRLGCVFENVVGAASVVNEKSSSLQSADDCLGFDRGQALAHADLGESNCNLLFDRLFGQFDIFRNGQAVFV